MRVNILRIPAIIVAIQMSTSAWASATQPADSVPYAAMDSVGLFSLDAISNSMDINARTEQLYKSPEAAAFQEYGKFGTGGTDGSIDISIPIYTISSRDLQIPITLHYGGRGIKVAEEASWVGLGWDLSIGGCINYVPAGQYDFLVRNAQWSDYLNALNQKSTSAFQFIANMPDYTVMEDLINGMGERDFYSVNLMGKGFLFFINPYDGKPTVIGADDNDYSITPFNADGWMIRDTMGFSYEFSHLEYNQYDGAGRRKSAWYMSSIETPEGETATFSYDVSYVKGLPQPYQWYYAQHSYVNGFIVDCLEASHSGYLPKLQPTFGSGFSYSNTEIEKPWLKSISTSSLTVTFETSGRTDLSGARKLDRIKVKDINGNVIFHHHFNYGVFKNSTVGGSCLNTNSPLISDPRNKERLKLMTLSQMSVDCKDSLTYEFAYNEKYPLPLKTSAAIDFWGYYNGQENSNVNPEITQPRSLIPALRDCTMGYSPSIAPHKSSLAVDGACRFSDSEKILSGTLSSITYPTGGKSVFTFEPHRFQSSPVYPLRKTGYKDIETSVEDLNYPSTPTSPGPVVNSQVDVSKSCKGYLTVIFEARSGKKLRDLKLAGAGVTLQPMAAPTYKKIQVTLDSCKTANMESTYIKAKFPVSLEAVSYMFIANLPAQIQYGEGWVKATLEFREIDEDIVSGGAGLRIAAIDNYDDDGSLTGRREFDYTLPGGKTSGQSIVPERATECRTKFMEEVTSRNQYEEIDQMAWTEIATIKINSSLAGGPAFTQAMVHGPVGYSRVTERELDGKGSVLRSTVNEFHVRCASEPYEDMHLLSSPGGGELTRRSVMDASGNIIKTEEFTYTDKKSSTIKCNLSIEDRYLTHVNEANCIIDAVVLNNIKAKRYLVSVYPYASVWRVLSGITAREHTPQGVVETKKTYTYNGANRLVSEENITSGNTGKRSVHKYSVDYPSTLPYSAMIPSPYYVRGIPVETTEYELHGGVYTESGKEKLTYVFSGSKADMLHLSRIDRSIAGGTLHTVDKFTYSDTGGTLAGSVKNATDKKAYLWSYAHSCPVAVIDGASDEEVTAWLGSSFISSFQMPSQGWRAC